MFEPVRGKAGERAVGKAPQRGRIQRCIGGDHDHDTAVAGRGRRLQRARDLRRIGQRLPHRYAGHGQVAAEIALHQHADGVAALRRFEPARAGADAALPAERDRAGAGADRAFLDLAVRQPCQRLFDLHRAHRACADVAEVAVVGFADDRIDRAHLFHAGLGEQVGGQRVGDLPHAQRAGQQYRRFQFAQFLYLGHAKQLAEAVADHDRRRHALQVDVAAVRDDRGHAGVEARALRQRGMADADAGDVGDRVAGASRQRADDDAGVAGTGPRSGRRGRGCIRRQECDDGRGEQQGRQKSHAAMLARSGTSACHRRKEAPERRPGQRPVSGRCRPSLRR